MDLSNPKVLQVFLKAQLVPGTQDGQERTIDIYQFNHTEQITGHTKEVVVQDTEMKCEVYDIKTYGNLMAVPLIKKHIYSHPSYSTIDF